MFKELLSTHAVAPEAWWTLTAPGDSIERAILRGAQADRLGLAFIGGGSLLAWLSNSPLLRSGLLEDFQPWQAAFLIVGLPGLLLVPLFFLVREPKRRGRGSTSPLSAREVLDIVTSRRWALVPMFTGFAMVLLVA